MRFSVRKLILILIDFAIINVATYLSLLLRFDAVIPNQYISVFLHIAPLVAIIKLIVYYVTGLYSSLWQYASIDELLQIFFATTVGAMLNYVYSLMSHNMLPRSVYLVTWLLTFIMIGASRFSIRLLSRAMKYRDKIHGTDKKRIMVIGAGAAGSIVIKELLTHKQVEGVPVAVIDDDMAKNRGKIHGVPIVGDRSKILETINKEDIDEVILAIPSANRSKIQEILNICKDTKCKLKRLPGVYELINENVSIQDIKDVSIEDLLGRDEIRLNTDEISEYLKDEVVLVTGGGGSIGSELCRQIARFNPKLLLILDISENSVYDLQQELRHTYKDKLKFKLIIASVRDKERLRQVFHTYRPGVVFHAAAHKHVPLMELNACEAIKNNVIGTLNTAECAHDAGVKKFVLISTDKAVNPTNIMGATKRVAEMIIQALDKQSKTEFVAVRFGNVLGSNGSVIPLFKKQIAKGGPVTVTHPEVTRYFMTIPEASQLVIQAGAMARGGEIFILDMGEPVKIIDLARDLIRLSGLEPDVDIRIEYTGLRPGEKLYEELLLKEEGLKATRHKDIFVGKPLELSFHEVMLCIKSLENSMTDIGELKECMARIVPTYSYGEGEVAATTMV